MTVPSLKKQIYRVAFFILANLLLLAGCSKTADQEAPGFELPPTPVLTIQSYWGVVTTSYLRVREVPENEERVKGALRQGDVVKITAIETRKINKSSPEILWYMIEKGELTGWVSEMEIELYNSLPQARTASQRLQ